MLLFHDVFTNQGNVRRESTAWSETRKVLQKDNFALVEALKWYYSRFFNLLNIQFETVNNPFNISKTNL